MHARCSIQALSHVVLFTCYAGPVGMGVAMAIGLFDHLDSVAMVPTHVWDAVPGDVVTSVILATAAATAAKMDIHEYKTSRIGKQDDPLVVHAGMHQHLLPGA